MYFGIAHKARNSSLGRELISKTNTLTSLNLIIRSEAGRAVYLQNENVLHMKNTEIESEKNYSDILFFCFTKKQIFPVDILKSPNI